MCIAFMADFMVKKQSNKKNDEEKNFFQTETMLFIINEIYLHRMSNFNKNQPQNVKLYHELRVFVSCF